MAKLMLGTREVTPAIVHEVASGYTEIPSYQVDANGVVTARTMTLSGTEFSGITDIGLNGMCYAFYTTGLTGVLNFPSLQTVSGLNGMYYAFYGCPGLTGVNFPELTTVSGKSGMYEAFQECTALTSVSTPKLTTISGASGMVRAFCGCPALTNVNMSKLTTISGASGIVYAFFNCTSLSSMSFPALTTITGDSAFGNTFRGCTALENVYFPALTTTSFGSKTNQFSNMLYGTGTNKTHTLHFPSNLSSTISGLTGYPTFGGTSGYVTLAFDLTATS